MVSTYAAPIAANQFFQGLFCRQEASHRCGPTAHPLPATAISATENLLDIVRTLCAPESGWPADQPQTPENLLPYVADEAEELLEALHSGLASPSSAEGEDNPASVVEGTPNLFSDLSAFLLWAIAASTPAAMKLLEGVATKLATQAEAYGVRLVPVLQVHLEEADYALDLATQTHFAPQLLLPEEIVLELPDQDIAALPLGDWQQLIWQGAIAVAPELEQWRQGTAISVLLPGQAWASATVTLSLKFVPLTLTVAKAPPTDTAWPSTSPIELENMGMPSARVWHAEPDPFTNWVDADILPNGSVEWSRRLSLESDVTFEDRAGLQTEIAPLAIQSLLNHQWDASDSAPQLAPLDLVAAVYHVIHPEQSAFSTVLQAPLTLTELCNQVKWLWIRSSQDVMSLMAGLSARYLAAGQTWEFGTVVTVGQLLIQDETMEQVIVDVTTGEWDAGEMDLDQSGILHLQGQTSLAQTLWQCEDLAAYCNRLVQARSPLLAHLMNAVPIKLTSPHDALFPETTDQTLTLKFQIAVRFVS